MVKKPAKTLKRIPTVVPARKLGLLGEGGISLVIAGPPGTGKSWFLGSMAETGKTLLIATLAREAKSVMYQRHDVDVILLQDNGWVPSSGKFEAESFTKFLDVIEWLKDDEEYKNIVVDNGTELAEAAWHEAMSIHGVATPAEMDDQRSRWLPYDQLDIYLDQAIKGIVSLTDDAARPKNVGISWHTQPPKDDTYDTKTQTTKASADSKGEGVEYEGTMLPMIRGRYRRRLAGQVDCYLMTDLQHNIKREEGKTTLSLTKGIQPEYKVQVRPNKERHTKFPGELPNIAYIDNEFKYLVELITASITGVKPKAAPAVKKLSKSLRPKA